MDDTQEISRAARSRIKAFRSGIEDLNKQIREYERLISRGGDGYDVDALAASNVHAGEQIGRIEKAIIVAQDQIAAAHAMQEEIDLRAALAEGVTIDADAYD